MLEYIEHLEGRLAEVEADRASSIAEANELQPYDLVDARTTYVSGEDPFRVAVALLAEASQREFEAGPSVTSLVLTVGWVPAAASVEGLPPEPSYYAGQLTVEG
jgi:hypothetical protein